MNRVTNQTYPSGQTINFTYNAQGELNSIPNILTDLTYNALGKVTLKEFRGALFTVLRYHSDDFRLGRIFTSGSGSLQDLNYTFDNVGNILSIVDALNSTTQSFTYDDLDRISTASETSGYTRAYTYNSIGNILTANESGTVQNYTYGFGSAGPHALTNYTDTVTSCGCTGSQPPSSGDWNIDECTSCSSSDINISGGLNINNDNTLTLSDGILYLSGDILMGGDITLGEGSEINFGGSGGTCSSDSVTYNLTYDENGNVIEGFGFYFDYNDANQLWRVRNSSGTVAEYFYDSNGQRFKKNESGTVTYYVGEHYEVVEYSNGSVVNTSYYFANGERVAKKVVSSGDSTGSTYYYHPDHLGSTNVISDSSGTLVETTKYFPFGLVRSGGTFNKYGFTGKEKDSKADFVYAGRRFYAPEVMGWTQPDPKISNKYNPQDLNRYAYVRNNPLKYTDPTGETPVLPYLVVYGTFMGVGYMGGVMWGSLEYHLTEYNPEAGWDYEREKELVSQRSSEGAMLGAYLATLGLLEYELSMMETGAEKQAAGEIATKETAKAGTKTVTKEMSTAMERHHLLPKQFKEFFSSKGLDTEKYTAKLPKDIHRLKPEGVHTGSESWNVGWKNFIKENPTATKEQILEHLGKMIKEFNIQEHVKETL